MWAFLLSYYTGRTVYDSEHDLLAISPSPDPTPSGEGTPLPHIHPPTPYDTIMHDYAPKKLADVVRTSQNSTNEVKVK